MEGHKSHLIKSYVTVCAGSTVMLFLNLFTLSGPVYLQQQGVRLVLLLICFIVIPALNAKSVWLVLLLHFTQKFLYLTQTVWNLIRCRIPYHLIWICTVLLFAKCLFGCFQLEVLMWVKRDDFSCLILLRDC